MGGAALHLVALTNPSAKKGEISIGRRREAAILFVVGPDDGSTTERSAS